MGTWQQKQEHKMNLAQAITICEQYRIDHSVSGFLQESLEYMLAAKHRNELTAAQRQALQTVMNKGLDMIAQVKK